MPGRGIVASYGIRFWLLVVGVGVGAGLGGAGLIELLRLVQHVAWSYHSGDFLDAVKRTSSTRRVLVLAVGGVVAGGGALALSRYSPGEVSESLWLRGARVPFWASIARGVHSIVIVALGASLGREAAPQQFGCSGGEHAERVGETAALAAAPAGGVRRGRGYGGGVQRAAGRRAVCA